MDFIVVLFVIDFQYHNTTNLVSYRKFFYAVLIYTTFDKKRNF